MGALKLCKMADNHTTVGGWKKTSLRVRVKGYKEIITAVTFLNGSKHWGKKCFGNASITLIT